MTGTTEWRAFGPPGTGKTTWLAEKAEFSVERFGEDQVSVCSLTRAAIREAVGRDLPIDPDNVTTLHARCKRALNAPAPAETLIPDFIEEHRRSPQLIGERAFPPGMLRGVYLDDEEEDTPTAGNGSSHYEVANILRQQQVHPDHWPPEVRTWYEAWRDFCESTGHLDYTGWLEEALAMRPLPPQQVVYIDEAQDHTPLQLAVIRSWNTRHAILIGDDDQCHPSGEQILTADRGYVPISELDPETDYLIAWDRNNNEMRKRVRFRRANRPYSGTILTLRTENGTTRVTPNHRLRVRWRADSRDSHLVYLMRRGDTWRVGTTRFYKYQGEKGIFGPSARARAERADALWILQHFDSAIDARLYEDQVAVRWGISKMVFNPDSYPENAGYTQEIVDDHHQSIRQWSRPVACLESHGRDPRYPLWVPSNKKVKFGQRTSFSVYAANADPALMELPESVEAECPRWSLFTREVDLHDGPVWSLEVPRYHTYVANGVVVENCIYEWSGAVPDRFFLPELPDGREMVLSQSYRVPRAVHAVAMDWIQKLGPRRRQKAYAPRPEEGKLIHEQLSSAWGVEELLNSIEAIPGTHMILTTAGYMLDEIIGQMRTEGVPFHNPYRTSNKRWNPLATPRERMEAYLTDPWTGADIVKWATILKREEVFVRGEAEAFLDWCKDEPETIVPDERLEEVFQEGPLWRARKGDLTLLRDHRRKGVSGSWDYAFRVMERPRAERDPRTIVGTIHSVKGGEADHVWLFPDLSWSAWKEYQDITTRDRTVRTIYVGMTRAREALHLCSPSDSPGYVYWPRKETA